MRRVIEAVALYTDRDELKAEYPELEDPDIQQALEFAADDLDDQVISLGAARYGCYSTRDYHIQR